MTRLVESFLKDESGISAVEYGLITALVAVSIIVAATALGVSIDSGFQGIADDNFTEDAGNGGPN